MCRYQPACRKREREREGMFIFTSGDITNNNSPNTFQQHVGTCFWKSACRQVNKTSIKCSAYEDLKLQTKF